MARDAAVIKPKFVPSEACLPRDNSGGLDAPAEFRYTAHFGDGGYILGGDKSYLSADGGGSDHGGQSDAEFDLRGESSRKPRSAAQPGIGKGRR